MIGWKTKQGEKDYKSNLGITRVPLLPQALAECRDRPAYTWILKSNAEGAAGVELPSGALELRYMSTLADPESQGRGLATTDCVASA